LTRSDQVHCWGRNDFGQLGDGTMTNRPTPILVSVCR
jgi:alpha-tubulin suppressor-like RCC1 family protein